MSLDRFYALTDIGLRREANEDNHCVVALAGALLCVVADGMGGHAAGEVASQIAVERMVAAARDGAEESGALAHLEQAALAAHWAIIEQARDGREGMGCTLTVALLKPGLLELLHVGDSRAYLLADGRLEQLTDDDSLVGDLVRGGSLTPAQARVHPYRSVLTKALGIGTEPTFALRTLNPPAGALLLLCSDGLTEHVDDDYLSELLAGAGSLEEAARALVAAANEGGGTDNITVVLARCPAGA